jgi:CNT family concentrative nucleoside transporter
VPYRAVVHTAVKEYNSAVRAFALTTNSRPFQIRYRESLSCQLSTLVMADLSHEHNSSPMPGVVRNPDPALDISREHHHEHLHHSALAEKGHSSADHSSYTIGTTVDPSIIPDADRRGHAVHDIEKAGGLEYEEKNSLNKSRTGSDPEAEVDPQRHSASRYYRKYRVVVHVFIGALFTG